MWVGHNPTKAMIPEPQRKSWKGQNPEVRKICEDKQHERYLSMAEELERIQGHYHQQLRDIAMKYGQSFETIVNYVPYSSRYKKQCAPSIYLARVSAKAEEINRDKSIGKKVHLNKIRRMVQEEMVRSDYEGLTKEEEATLLDHLKEKQEVKFQGAWRSNESAAADCRQDISCINQEIDGLAHRTGAHFLGFLSHSDIHDTFQPTLMSDSPASVAFFKCVVGISAQDVLVKFEQLCCAQSLMHKNDSERIKYGTMFLSFHIQF
ncbi:hypothetical protein IW262DRAFT_1293647 [Armillaria fumosa]|nr:hypothetical protein IW262DRAFT_1293647 [Armillaria fumosa]